VKSFRHSIVDFCWNKSERLGTIEPALVHVKVRKFEPRVVAAAMLLCAMTLAAMADTITVVNTNDSGAGSLRQVVANANNGDTIDFDSALKGQTITLTSGELSIEKSIAINGLGANLLTISRAQDAPAFRIFHVMPNLSVRIQGVSINNGVVKFDPGGGILNETSALLLID